MEPGRLRDALYVKRIPERAACSAGRWGSRQDSDLRSRLWGALLSRPLGWVNAFCRGLGGHLGARGGVKALACELARRPS